MTGLLLFGAEGRMGREVAALAAQYGFTLGEKAEAAIDFSHPDAVDAVRDAVLARRLQVVAQCVTSSALADKSRDRRDAAKLRRELIFLSPPPPKEHIIVERRELRCEIAQCLASCCLFFHDDSFFLVYPVPPAAAP